MNKPFESLETVIIEPKQPPQAAVIWLHGLGADGHDFEPIVPELHLPESLHVRFIFPHAPMRPVTINQGMRMRAWYDISLNDLIQKQDEVGISQSALAVEELIQTQLDAGISSRNIVLAGFSQGGAIALHVGLRYAKPLAGILALSTYLPVHETVTMERHASNQQTPIMMAHGIYDPVVPFVMGEFSKQWLQNLEYKVAWYTYPMMHQVCREEIEQIGLWLQKVLEG